MEPLLEEVKKVFPGLKNYRIKGEYILASSELFFYEFSIENNELFWMIVYCLGDDENNQMFWDCSDSLLKLKDKWIKDFSSVMNDFLETVVGKP